MASGKGRVPPGNQLANIFDAQPDFDFTIRHQKWSMSSHNNQKNPGPVRGPIRMESGGLLMFQLVDDGNGTMAVVPHVLLSSEGFMFTMGVWVDLLRDCISGKGFPGLDFKDSSVDAANTTDEDKRIFAAVSILIGCLCVDAQRYITDEERKRKEHHDPTDDANPGW